MSLIRKNFIIAFSLLLFFCLSQLVSKPTVQHYKPATTLVAERTNDPVNEGGHTSRPRKMQGSKIL